MLWPSHLTGAEREPFARQADADWRAFLRHRAAELRPGGRLVVVVPVLDRDGSWGIGELAARTTAALREMVRDGALREAELARMVVPVYNRTAAELEAPFADRTLDLVVEAQSLDRTPDPLWQAYLASRDAAALADGYAGFVRAAFGPTLAGALDPDRSPDERGAFLARLEAGVSAHVAGASGPLFNAAVMSMLIAKPQAPFSKPDPDRGELDEGEIAGGQLVVAGRDPPVLLQPADQPLDHVALPVQPPVHQPRRLLGPELRDDGAMPCRRR